MFSQKIINIVENYSSISLECKRFRKLSENITNYVIYASWLWVARNQFL